MSLKINVILFGQLEQLTNCKQVELQDVKDTEELKSKITAQFPQLEGFEYLIALNQEIINENTTLKNNDELALLPPFAGG